MAACVFSAHLLDNLSEYCCSGCVRNCSLLEILKVDGDKLFSPIIFIKGDNLFLWLLFASLDSGSLPKRRLLLKERICSQRS